MSHSTLIGILSGLAGIALGVIGLTLFHWWQWVRERNLRWKVQARLEQPESWAEAVTESRNVRELRPPPTHYS